MSNSQPQPLMFPVMFPQQPPPERAGSDEVPARVRLALAAACHFADELSEKAVPHGLGVAELAPRELDPMETGAFRAALGCLTAYFKGELPLDDREKDRRAARKKQQDGDRVLLRCYACNGGPMKATCALCRGAGSLLVGPGPTEE